ncbi:YegP family protein [Shimia sp. SDUM112013]|uniref:YegP family protein n=1 Tax=Shimia sp. SDUM112013 TaxID=3136160 RepID=UPI0032ED3CCA
MAGKFELYTDKAGEFRFRLKAGNGENILASEGYKQKASAENGIASVQKNAGDEARYERKETASGKFMFNLKASNGQVIGTSQSYTSASGRDNGIESVKRNAAEARIDDQT